MIYKASYILLLYSYVVQLLLYQELASSCSMVLTHTVVWAKNIASQLMLRFKSLNPKMKISKFPGKLCIRILKSDYYNYHNMAKI